MTSKDDLLRSSNHKGKDLNGADFSGADVRGYFLENILT
jgi:uncharacterized protein YjbI with pentapeptide repeats